MVKGEVIVLDRDAEEVAPPKDADDGDCDEKFIVVDCSRPILVEKKNKNSIQANHDHLHSPWLCVRLSIDFPFFIVLTMTSCVEVSVLYFFEKYSDKFISDKD
ncbi:hypothetical protein L3Y34_019617 [Caenorhabditis briggsae]|uniref:Uncharacterized protein n=1 Tax=Caenorhabditis briggsae TaxID=6238 RepID=A0AAE9IWY2_CAEBR|nr:hypothetical protein L3Y34_019617 [Caenorhabditis briggsae]